MRIDLNLDTKSAAIRRECENHGVIWDPNVRWEQGVDHHPEARRIYGLLKESDWALCRDYFEWKDGGDGDNGETLMFSLSALLELRDARIRAHVGAVCQAGTAWASQYGDCNVKGCPLPTHGSGPDATD